jgi:hypothetical protein
VIQSFRILRSLNCARSCEKDKTRTLSQPELEVPQWPKSRIARVAAAKET